MTDEPRPPLQPEVLPAEKFTADLTARATPGAPPVDGPGQLPFDSARRIPGQRVALVLLVLTCATTFYAGYDYLPATVTVIDPATGEEVPLRELDPETGQTRIKGEHTWQNGLIYASAVMLILGAHEMGHYLQARRYGVPATLPLFIPMPFGPLGTMGAVIVQQAGAADRKAMFDIAISGPLAGLAVALPLNWWAIQQSKILTIDSGGFTNSLIVEWMVAWTHGPLKQGQDIDGTPLVFAGWVGIFITALNLIPIGQLDGGHILYCLLGKKAHRIARALYVGAIGVVVFQVLRGHYEYRNWVLMLLLVGVMGTRHPPTANDRVPLGKARIVLGWLTLAFILVGFVPSLTYDNKDAAAPGKPVQQGQVVVKG